MAETQAWDGDAVRNWLERRVAAARSDQVTAERGGRDRQDDCDKAAAEEMVCAFFKTKASIRVQADFLEDLKTFIARDEYLWSGVYNDAKFDRHVRTYARKLVKMAKGNTGFDNVAHYQQ